MENAPLPELEIVEALVGGGISEFAPLHGDGSVRRYYRVRTSNGTFILLEGPDREENGAWLRVNEHLSRGGVRVPKVEAADEERGLILLEDLGDVTLFSRVKEELGLDEAVECYRNVLRVLCRMQVGCAEGFTLKTGFGSAPYNRGVMMEQEALYFLKELIDGYLGLEEPHGVRYELETLACEASEAPAGYLLHRDFQSRNLMCHRDEWIVIDFQGAIPGPLAYDAAALLLDPYVELPLEVSGGLFDEYCRLLSSEWGVDPDPVRDSWGAIGAFRLMQALGAYAKLGGRFKKPGFIEHIPAGLRHLAHQLARTDGDYPILSALIERSLLCPVVWNP